MITEDDLIVDGDEKTLALRFKNCTGNEIEFAGDYDKVDQSAYIEAGIALSVDDMYKHLRSRTIEQVVSMVTRWRIIANGFFDTQIQRYVHTVTLAEAAVNLAERHRKVTGED